MNCFLTFQSSGSGSETGSQTKNVVTPNGEADPDNNTGSNDDSDDASIGLNIRDGSDNGSGTQVSILNKAHSISFLLFIHTFKSLQMFVFNSLKEKEIYL